MSNSSRAVNQRVSHWIRELGNIINSPTDSTPEQPLASRREDGDQNVNNGATPEYTVGRDPEEPRDDPEASYAGIEIRSSSQDADAEPILLGLICDRNGRSTEDDLNTLANYITKDQDALAEQRRPLRCFITNGLREICIRDFHVTEYHNEERTEFSYEFNTVHDSDCLYLNRDVDAIRDHLKNSLVRNAALAAEL